MIARATLGAIVAMIALGTIGCGTCDTPIETGAGATGTIVSTVGDGRTATISLGSSTTGADIDVGPNDVTLSGQFTDAAGLAKNYSLHLAGLSQGTVSLGAGSQLCDYITANDCAPVTGTMVVRAISSDCKSAGNCAESIDADLDATSDWNGDTLVFKATLQRSGAWSQTKCEED